jgi:hydroxymethylbilane synthase
MTLKLGTRGSDLALTQARWVAAALANHGVETELVVISTSGDRSEAPSFGAIGPQGVFVREIEQALLDAAIDIAVHSYKDLPTQSPAGLVVAATPARRDVADWLICRRNAARHDPAAARVGSRRDTARVGSLAGGAALDALAKSALAEGARVGTSSARRQSWLRSLRPDLDIQPLRGNVPTRLKRLASGDYDAIVLAGAGIERLDEAGDLLAPILAGLVRTRLDPERFVPAPAQGALALQCRRDDAGTGALEALAAVADADTAIAVALEREALRLAEGGCDAAFGAWARRAGDGHELIVMAERDARVVTARAAGDAETDGLAAAAMRALDGGAGSAH